MKPFEDMTLTELANWQAWQAMERILKGMPLREVMWHAADATLKWKAARDKATGEPK